MQQSEIKEIIEQFPSLISKCDLAAKRALLCMLYNSIKKEENNCTGKSVNDYTEYVPNFVDPQSDDVLLAGIKADLEKMGFDKKAANKKKIQTRWYGESFRKKPKEFPFDDKEVVICSPLTEVPFIKQLVEKINGEDLCGPEKVALVSYQPSAGSSLRSHADDESYIDQNHPIKTFSLGCTKNIDVLTKPKRKSKFGEYEQKPIKLLSQTLVPGSLFVMKSGCQKYFLHRINPSDMEVHGADGERYSVSVRTIEKNHLLCNTADTDETDSANDSEISLFGDNSVTIDPNMSTQPSSGFTTIILGDSIDRDLVPARLQKGENLCINLSQGGSKIKDIDKIINDLPNTHGHITADQVIISIGVNDIRYCRGKVQHLKDSYIDLIHKLKYLYPNVKVFVRSILPVKILNEFTAQNVLKFNKLLLHICRTERCYYVDVFNTFLDSSGRDRNSLLYKDNVHLKQNGISILARKYIFIINKNTFNPIIT